MVKIGQKVNFILANQNNQEIQGEIYGVNKNAEGKEKEESIQFKKAEVITGVPELGYTEITLIDKLPENSKIVTKGAFYILSKSKGSAEEE